MRAAPVLCAMLLLAACSGGGDWVKPGADGTLVVSGAREVRMTEFGLKPPTLMLGTMKVDEKITVGFEVVLKN